MRFSENKGRDTGGFPRLADYTVSCGSLERRAATTLKLADYTVSCGSLESRGKTSSLTIEDNIHYTI